jgi:hypothetical protein
VTTACEAGSGDDTIVLEGGRTYSMGAIVDDPYNYTGPTATPIIFSRIVIEANGATLVRLPSAAYFRLFAIAAASADRPAGAAAGAGALDIRNANIKGFIAKGGNGSFGGGGGLGAGGAIFVNGGTLIVESTAFEGNAAFGGNGGDARYLWFGTPLGNDLFTMPGGGGGGMGGDGGPIFESSFGGAGGGGARGKGARGPGGFGPGSGGGGTLTDGSIGTDADGGTGGAGGFRCGGKGADISSLFLGLDGDDADCDGGGGGGGGDLAGTGADGRYGGGGGGGGRGKSDPDIGFHQGDAGHGGFGGGGGSGSLSGADDIAGAGGKGGFGGGGGAGDLPGEAGFFAGAGGSFTAPLTNIVFHGGGGAGLGGAIFNHRGTVRIYNSTFNANSALRGCNGDACNTRGSAQNGTAVGGAIFSLNGALAIYSSTISGNQVIGADTEVAGAGVVAVGVRDFTLLDPPPPSTFELRNSIIAGNNASRECFWGGEAITAQGSGKLIVNNGVAGTACPGVVSSSDPQLGPLQFNVPGTTKTMMIGDASPAYNAGVAYSAAEIASAPTLATDQRGISRPQFGSFDIGAYEAGCSTLIPPASFVQATDPNACNAIVTYPLPTANGSCGTVTCSPVSGSVFALGPTSVACRTATGLTAGFTIGVKDTQAPTIDPLSVARSALWPIDHTLVNVGLAGGATTDNCSGSVTSIRVFANEDDETDTGDGVYSPDAANVGIGTLRVRAERLDSGSGRVYLIVATVTDASSNSAFRVANIVIPKSQSTRDMKTVNNLAAAAVDYALSHNGSPPAGYFLVGDGRVIGPKQ